MQASQNLTALPSASEAPNRGSIAFWAATGLLAFGMISGGTGQLIRAKFNVDGMVHLGYPLYALTIISLWKLAGIVVVLLPGLPLAKEWAYAGLFFLLISGTASHLAVGDGPAGALPAFVFACLTALSWHLRPASRRVRS
jgi:DoxX-like protein